MSAKFSYDAMPYPSKFFLQTHPDRLAVLATFFGLSPAPVETCRVLELGCGNGSNLISHAYNLPDARFVGVDLAAGHIDDAKRGAEELGLRNCDFIQADVAEMRAGDYGEFDYIIAHGLFSWVPDTVRERVLAICSEMLSANGVGYISYNAFPGAHYRQMVQRMMRYHARDEADPVEKVGKAITFLSFLAENAADREIYAPILSAELTRHFAHDAADIFHDDLSDLNRAFYIHEFAEMLGGHSLRFLAEAELHAMGTHGLSGEAREFVATFDDIVQREQYLDFLRGRIFRQTLFCRAGNEPDHAPDPEVLKKFRLASSIRPQAARPDLVSNRVERFVGSKGFGIEIDNPLTKAALTVLGESWGRAIGFAELLETAAARIISLGGRIEDPAKQSEIAAAILFQLCRETALIDLHLFQPAAPVSVSERPRVNRLAAWQLPQASNVTTLLNLDVRIDDAVSRRLLELLDGSRTRAEASAELRLFVEGDDEIDGWEDLLAGLDDWFEKSLEQLARLGMFES